MYLEAWSAHCIIAIFRGMEDTAWFDEKSECQKLKYLSELMYSSEESAKEEFGILLKLLPVDLVDSCAFLI